MDYKDIINEIPNEKIIQLIKAKQLDWFILTSVENQKKLNTFTRTQLIDADFEKGLSDYCYLLETSLSFHKNSEIYGLANKYFKENLFSSAKSSQVLMKKFLDEYPTEKNELINSVDYFNEVTIDLLFGERSEKIASLINDNRICIRSLNNHIDKFSIAEMNTLIDDKYYQYAYAIDCLLTLFPRDIPFPKEIAQKIVKVNRNNFLKLPLENQLNSQLFSFATNNIIYGDNWTVYDEVDPKNIPISSIDERILDLIEHDYDSLIIVKAFIEYKAEYILHHNVQKLINDPAFAIHFAKYKKFLNNQQKYLAGIYNKENIPLNLEIQLGYQDDDVLIEIIKKTTNNYQILEILHCLLQRNIKINDYLDDTTRTKIIDALNILLPIELDRGLRYFNNEIIIKVVEFVMDISVDFKLLRLLEKTCENKKDFDDLLMKRLTNLEKIEYLDYSLVNDKSKKTYI